MYAGRVLQLEESLFDLSKNRRPRGEITSQHRCVPTGEIPGDL